MKGLSTNGRTAPARQLTRKAREAVRSMLQPHVVYTVPPSLPAFDDAETPRIVLRDGSVATVRRATTADVPSLRQFFQDLSSESRYRRFLSAGAAPDDVV